MYTPASSSVGAVLLLCAQSVLGAAPVTNLLSGGVGSGGTGNSARSVPPEIQKRQYYPSPSTGYDINYCRFFDFSSAVLGNKIWLEGGAFTDRSDKIYSNPGYVSIDFSESFNLPLTSTSSNVDTSLAYRDDYPLTWLGGLYSDGKSKLYKYGGFFPDPYSYPLSSATTQYNSLYELDTESREFNRLEVPSNVARSANGAYVSVPESGFGFWMGGFISNNTDSQFETWKWPTDFMVLDSVLTINTETGSITNTSRTAGYFNPTSAGELVHLPAAGGKKGYLVSIGGFVGPAGILSTQARNEDFTLSPMNTSVSIYDIDSDKWYTQSVSGDDRPPNRQLGCAVLATAQDRTSFNIIVHGGANWGVKEGYGDIWVLSLPSFQWIKIDNDSSNTIRMAHSCHMMTDTQMVVVGGRGIDQYTYVLQGGSWKNTKMGKCDPKGFVNVLDVNTFEWKTDFDPSYKGYLVHNKIVDVIGGNANGSAKSLKPKNGWDNGSLRTIFDSLITQSPAKSPTPVPSLIPKKNKPKLGVIVGGVVGGIVLLAIIAGGAFYYYRTLSEPSPQPQATNLPVAQTQQTSYLPPPPPVNPPPGGSYYQPVYPTGVIGQQPLNEKAQHSPYQHPAPGYVPPYTPHSPHAPYPYGQPGYPQPPPADVPEMAASMEYSSAPQSPQFNPAQHPVSYSELPANGYNTR